MILRTSTVPRFRLTVRRLMAIIAVAGLALDLCGFSLTVTVDPAIPLS